MASSPYSRTRVVLAFACVYLCWGMTYGAIHIAVQAMAPPLVGALRCLISTLIFAVICRARGLTMRVPHALLWRLAVVGVLIMSVNNVLLIWAESLVPSGWASVVISMVPVLVALMETSLPNGETLSARGWLGTALAAVGIMALLWPSLHGISASRGLRAAGLRTDDLRTLAGFAILVVAALAFAAGSVLGRRFRFQLDTFVATAWQVGIAGVVNLLIAVGGGTLRTAHWTRDGALAILFLAVFGTVVGLTAYTYLLQHVPVTKVSTYAFVNPVIAVLLGAAAFGERMAAPEIVGVVVILVGVAMVIVSRTASGPVGGTLAPGSSVPAPLESDAGSQA